MAVALTTRFDPPARCTTDLWLMTFSPGRKYELLGGDDYAACLPPLFKPSSEFFYTPGLFCPVGYSTACVSTQVIADETATIATCCPTGYSCQTRNAGEQWPWETTLGCTSACSLSTVRTLTNSEGTYTDRCEKGAGVNAYSVQLRYREADRITITTSSVAASNTANLSGTPLPLSTPTSGGPLNTNTAEPANDSGLPPGTKAGIGIGSVLAIALLGALGAFAWRIRRNSRRDAPYTGIGEAEFANQSPPVYAPKDSSISTTEVYRHAYELNQVEAQRHELNQINAQRYELNQPEGAQRFELPGSR